MKTTSLWKVTAMGGILGAAFFLTPGCDRPEIPREEYGTVMEEFPVFSDAPETLPLPEGVDENPDQP